MSIATTLSLSLSLPPPTLYLAVFCIFLFIFVIISFLFLQLMEITAVFGPLKSYHFEVNKLVNEPYAFLELAASLR
ncbi:hypothetical protein Dimus_005942 [Dionaea muscipula]